jgi:mannose-6-phosphate isomerase-like protein (cupin superfamily)
MTYSRRNWCLMLSMLVAPLDLSAQESSLPSRAFRFEDLHAETRNGTEFRPILKGTTRDGCPLEVHETRLAPGAMPHSAHRHRQEEMFLIREGTIEATISGRSTRLGPGSVVFVASSEEHGVRNVGATSAQYFVVAIGKDA